MAITTLNIGKNNGFKKIANLNEFTVSGEFNYWLAKPDHHFVSKVPLEIDVHDGKYYNIFYANFCDKQVKTFEIHIAKVYTQADQNLKLSPDYFVAKPKVHFNLNPAIPKAAVEVSVLLYDLDLRCDSDKLLYLCGQPGVQYPKHPLKDINCKSNEKIMAIDDGPGTQPERKKGNILQGGN